MWAHALSTLAFSVSWSFQTKDYRYRDCLVPHVDTCLVYQDDGLFHVLGLSLDLLKIAHNFALVYREAGRQQDALELTGKIVEANKKTLGEEHPENILSNALAELILSPRIAKKTPWLRSKSIAKVSSSRLRQSRARSAVRVSSAVEETFLARIRAARLLHPEEI